MIDDGMRMHAPDRGELRKFSFIMGILVPGIFGLLLPWIITAAIPYWPWIIGVGFIASGIIFPDILKPVYIIWMRFGILMSRIMNPLILGLVFFVIFVPVACFMRLINRDPLCRRFDTMAETYRIPRSSIKKQSMENPF